MRLGYRALYDSLERFINGKTDAISVIFELFQCCGREKSNEVAESGL